MKIAIFGDSWGIHGEDYPWKDHRGPSWVDLLKQHYTVDNYCVHGNSTQNIYYQYLKHKNNYDKIIILITSPNRLTIPAFNDVESDNHVNYSKITLNMGSYTAEVRQAVNYYYQHLYNEPLVYCSIYAIVQNLLTDTKCIVIPCFLDSVPNFEQPWKTGNNLVSLGQASIPWLDEIMQQDHPIAKKFNRTVALNQLFDVNETHKIKLYDTMKCHMSEENNQILFEFVKQAINNNQNTVNLMTDSFVGPTKPFDFYYAVHNIRLENGQWVYKEDQKLTPDLFKYFN